MAATVTDPVGFPISIGDRWLTYRKLDMDSSYPTDGEPLTFAQLGFSQEPDLVLVLGRLGYTFEYFKATQKLKVYRSDYAAALPGPSVEVTDATDLSAVTAVDVLAIGKYRN